VKEFEMDDLKAGWTSFWWYSYGLWIVLWGNWRFWTCICFREDLTTFGICQIL
jgi:hypothetical protein